MWPTKLWIANGYTSPNFFVKHMRSHHWELLQSTFNAVFHGEEDLIELSNYKREEGYDGEEGDEAGTLKV